jgi:hypothetical protein
MLKFGIRLRWSASSFGFFTPWGKRLSTCRKKEYGMNEEFEFQGCSFKMYLFLLLFFSGEGPRSRRYGRTAALRLLVQPCDEDEDDDDDYFLTFS